VLNILLYRKVLGNHQLKALKKALLGLMVGLIIVFLSFFPWEMLLPPWNVVKGRNWIINSGTEGILQIDLLWGATVQGQIWCYGGNNDIDFLITDSGGNVCLNPGRIHNEQRFKWHVLYNDIYSFKLNNTLSWSSKDVGYLIRSYYYMHIFLIIGAVLVVTGLFLTLREVIKRKGNSKQPSPLLVEEGSKELIKGLRKETEDLKSAVKDLQATIVELLERAKRQESD